MSDEEDLYEGIDTTAMAVAPLSPPPVAVEEDEPKKPIGPRVKVGPDGELIIDEQSLVSGQWMDSGFRPHSHPRYFSLVGCSNDGECEGEETVIRNGDRYGSFFGLLPSQTNPQTRFRLDSEG